MRLSLPGLCLLLAACASSGTVNAGSTVERHTTGVTYTGAGGSVVNVELETRSIIETRAMMVTNTPQELWAAIPLAYGDLGIPLSAYDSVQLYVGNPGYIVPRGRVGTRRISAYLNCGADPLGSALADRYAVRLNVVSRVQTRDGATFLETQVSGEASQRGTAGNPVPCASTGLLEEDLANAVKLRLAGLHPRAPN